MKENEGGCLAAAAAAMAAAKSVNEKLKLLGEKGNENTEWRENGK